MPNYNFVIDSTFKPFTMQEMLVPFMMYKEAFEKSEDAYNELAKGASTFDYLAGEIDPEDEKAAQLYRGYANDLEAQAKDLAENGLSIGNRSALTSLKRRYHSEIGRLVEADTALKKEMELRRAMEAKDPSMLWAKQKLNLSDFLDKKTPNLYGISGTDLYSKAAVASAALSKRQFTIDGSTKTLGGHYYDFITRRGYSPEQLNRFGAQIAADFANEISVIPELKMAADQILEANGVNDNLDERGLQKARTQVIRGLIDGAVYEEQHSPQRDLGTPTWAEARADQWKQAEFGLALRREQANEAYKAGQLELLKERVRGKNGKSGSGDGYGAILNKPVRLEWDGNTPNDLNGEADDDMKAARIIKDDEEYVSGTPKSYDDLPKFMQNKIDKLVGRGNVDDYSYFVRDYKSGWFGDKAAVDIVPFGIKKGAGAADDLSGIFGMMGTTPQSTSWNTSYNSDYDDSND